MSMSDKFMKTPFAKLTVDLMKQMPILVQTRSQKQLLVQQLGQEETETEQE